MGGTAFRGLSDEGLLHMEGLMIEQGGSKAGTAMMSIYQNLIAGRTPKKTMGMLQDLGLAQLEMQTHGAVGGKPMKSLVMTGIKESAMLQADPAKWMTDVLLPALAKKGVTKDADVLKAVNDVLSNRNASNQGSIMTTQDFQVMRDYRLAKGAMGADQVISMYKPSASGAEADFEAAWTDFKKQFGQTMLPAITNMLQTGASILRTIAAASASPTGQAMQGFGSSVLHGFAWPYRAIASMFSSDANAATNGSGLHDSPFVMPKQQSIKLESKVFIDSREIGRAATDYLVNGFGQAQSTNSGFDMTRNAPPIGHSYVK
jgi:hypothetical protein